MLKLTSVSVVKFLLDAVSFVFAFATIIICIGGGVIALFTLPAVLYNFSNIWGILLVYAVSPAAIYYAYKYRSKERNLKNTSIATLSIVVIFIILSLANFSFSPYNIASYLRIIGILKA